MAELVDALVSKTNDGNIVPVRPRLQVLTALVAGMVCGVLMISGDHVRCLVFFSHSLHDSFLSRPLYH